MNFLDHIPTWCWAIMVVFTILLILIKAGELIVIIVQLLWNLTPILFVPICAVALYLYWLKLSAQP